MALNAEKQELVGKAIAALQGTCRNHLEVLEEYGLTDERDVTEAIDAELFECDCCGWWFERCEESNSQPGCCTACEPDEDDETD